MANTFHQNLKQSFANFKAKYIGNLPSGVTVAQINNNLTEIIGTQSGAGTKTVSLPSGKNKILCITKKSGVVVESKEIPVAVLNTNDVIPLGNIAPIIGIDGTGTGANFNNKQVTLDNLWSGQTTSISASAEGNRLTPNGTVKLASDLSKTTGATITYNGNNSFTITSVAGLDVYLIA